MHEHGITLLWNIGTALSSVFSFQVLLVFYEIYLYEFLNFRCYLNSIFILISNSSLARHRNPTDSCILIIYPATLLTLCVTPSWFSVDSTGLSTWMAMLSSEFHLQLLVWTLSFFSCLEPSGNCWTQVMRVDLSPEQSYFKCLSWLFLYYLVLFNGFFNVGSVCWDLTMLCWYSELCDLSTFSSG